MASTEERFEIEQYFDRLWPLNRSITGDGVRKSHDIIGELVNMERFEIPSGKQVFDWTVPPEWKVNDAYIISPDGERILDVNDNNLHLMSYSEPFNGTLSLEELQKHLYSIPDQPEWIPYRTSYYKRNWGFCLPDKMRRSLREGQYRVVVDTSFNEGGSLTLSEAILPGETSREILFTSYTCHPSMAINELSGPLVTAFLYRRIASWPSWKYTYRFVFGPESIGALCYLAMRGEQLNSHLDAGFVVTCVGDSGAYRLKKSKRGNTVADRAAEYVLAQSGLNHKVIDFNPSGSDERQYCSLGFNLPVSSISRSVYGEYPQYHTSADNKDLIDFKSMVETIDFYESLAKVIDCNKSVRNKIVFGEPQLSKHCEIYPGVNQGFPGEEAMAVKWLIHFADGETDLLGIAQRSGIDIAILGAAAEKLIEVGLFE